MYRRILLPALLVLIVAPALRADQIHVSPSGDDATGSGTALNPVKTIARGIVLAASPGDSVMLAPGTYSGPGNQDIEIPPRALNIGPSAEPGARILAPDVVSRAFVIPLAVTRDTVIHDLTIQNARRYSSQPAAPDINPNAGSTPAVGTVGGGAIFIRTSTPSLINLTFIDCRVDLSDTAAYTAAGGAIYADSNSYPLIQGCKFIGCQAVGGPVYTVDPNQYVPAGMGGAIALYQSAAQINDCEFTGNKALCSDDNTFNAITRYAMGGALCLADSACYVLMNRCTFTNNEARVGLVSACTGPINCAAMGGAVYAGGAFYPTGTVFQGNNARYDGAATLMSGGRAEFTNCVFDGNSSTSPHVVASSGLYDDGDPAATYLFQGCLFQNHSSQTVGGLLGFYAYPGKVVNCTFLNNNLPNSGFLITAVSLPRPTEISHCSFVGNTLQRAVLGYNTEDVFHPNFSVGASLFQGNLPTSLAGFIPFSRGGNLLSDYPSYTASTSDQSGIDAQLAPGPVDLGPAGTLLSGGGVPHFDLPPGSPAIDFTAPLAGIDARNFPRPLDGDFDGGAVADAGAIEYAPAVTPTPTPTPIPGDFDLDGCVGVGDFLILLDNWQLGPNCL